MGMSPLLHFPCDTVSSFFSDHFVQHCMAMNRHSVSPQIMVLVDVLDWEGNPE